MRVKPTGKNILIRSVGDGDKTNTSAGGIILKRDITTGLKPAIVVEVGHDVFGIKVDNMVFPVWSEAKPMSLNGDEYAIIAQEHIVAVVTEM